jgi:Zn finger protein HypA/HybF involved in hydrogenase expression
MHDLLISRDIIETAQKQGKVKAITVEVGDLGHLPADELEETLKRMVPWKIRIKKKKAKAKCTCGFVGGPTIAEHRHGSSVYYCPKCGEVPEITEGRDIVLKQVEVE